MISEEVKSLIESGNPFGKEISQLLEEEQNLQNKWAAVFSVMENISGTKMTADRRRIAGRLLENQHKYLGSLSESTLQANVGNYMKFIFPILMNVLPNLITPELVSYQPMPAQIGAFYYYDLIKGVSKGASKAGDTTPRDFDPNYISETVDNEPLGIGDGVKYGGAGSVLAVVLNWSPVRPQNSSRNDKVLIEEVDSVGNVVQSAVDDGTGAFDFSPAGGSTSGTINYANGSIADFKFQSPPAAGNVIRCSYKYDGELNAKQPEFRMDLKKKLVEAEAHRVKALWSQDAEEDLMSSHGLDMQSILTNGISTEYALEKDRGVLKDILQQANQTVGAWDRIPAAGILEVEHIRSLLTVLSGVSSAIHNKTKRAPANWCVVGTTISALLGMLTTHADYRAAYQSGSDPNGAMDLPRPLGGPGNYGIYKLGTLQNKLRVYEDPFHKQDTILVGLQGTDILNAGYCVGDYIPLMMTNAFQDPSDGSFRKMLRARYARSMLRPEFYGQVRCANVPTF